MTSHTWTVTINYGSGDVDLHNYGGVNLLRQDGFTENRLLHKNLKPVQDKCTFVTNFDTTLANDLLTLDYDQIVTASIQRDGSDWFTGVIRPVTDFTIEHAANSIEFECLDNSYLLKRIPTTGGEIENDTVDDIVDTLLTAAGYSAAERAGIPTINKTITSFRYEARNKDYWTIIKDLLFSFGYVFYFDASGVFQCHDWIAASITVDGTADETTITGDLSVDRDDDRSGLAFNPDAESETIKVPYYTYETGSKTMISRTRHLELDDSSDKLPANTTHDYGKTDDKSIKITKVASPKLYYEYSAKYTEIAGTDIYRKYQTGPISSGYSSSTSLLRTFTARDLEADIQFQYPSGGDGIYTITSYRVDATVTYRILVDTVEIDVPAGAEEISTTYIETLADAKNLAQAIFNRLQHSVYVYKFRLEADYDIGDYLTLQNTALNISTTVRVVKKRWRFSKAADIWDYECEGAAELGTLTATASGLVGEDSVTSSEIIRAVSAANRGLSPSGSVTKPIYSDDIVDDQDPTQSGTFTIYGSTQVKQGTLYDEDNEPISGAPPIGATYIQFPGAASPATIWPTTTWEKLFDDEGSFFRTEGGEASSWESGVQSDEFKSHRHAVPRAEDTGGTGSYLGGQTPDWTFGYTNYTGWTETRPTNRTIRVWERIGEQKTTAQEVTSTPVVDSPVLEEIGEIALRGQDVTTTPVVDTAHVPTNHALTSQDVTATPTVDSPEAA